MFEDIARDLFLSTSVGSKETQRNGHHYEGMSLMATKPVTAGGSIGQIRQTQIVCTMGPACDSEGQIEALVKAGMNVARLNFSHGTHSQHAAVISRIRTVSERLNRPVIIMQDLQGPKIRTGTLDQGQAIELKAGAAFTITTREIKGNAREVSTSYVGLPGDVQPGDRLLLDDGLIELEVSQIEGPDVHTRVIHGGLLKEHKGVNLPGVEVGLPILTKKDRADLAFGLTQGVDWLAISFVNKADDIVEVKRTVASLSPQAALLPVIAKIETVGGVANLAAILEVADGVMVARGDLGVELAPEFVPPTQKRIIKAAKERGKFVITATQMLDSMINRPRPTRAEAADVANAVYDGTDAVMLSAETASGAFPLEALSMMAKIVDVAEATYLEWGYRQIYSGLPLFEQPHLAIP